MRLVHAMFFSHDKIKRPVTDLPDSIRTITESDDARMARAWAVGSGWEGQG